MKLEFIEYNDVPMDLKLDAVFASSYEDSYEEILTDMLQILGLRTIIKERNPGIMVSNYRGIKYEQNSV